LSYIILTDDSQYQAVMLTIFSMHRKDCSDRHVKVESSGFVIVDHGVSFYPDSDY